MKKSFLIPAALLFAAATIAHAQPGADSPDGGSPDGRHRRPPPDPLLIALDSNHDGVLSADEIAGAAKALLTLDKNGDGQLDQSELRPPRPADAPQGDRPPPPPSPLLQALDANHDGVISADEIANASKALLALDTNGDGTLDHDELCPPPPEGPPGLDGPPPPPPGP
jgi:hypothetical protein